MKNRKKRSWTILNLRRKNSLSKLILLFLFYSAGTCYGQELLETAKQQEDAGNSEEAFTSYCSWLKQNSSSEVFLSIFHHAFDLQINVETQLDCLYTLLEKIDKPQKKYSLLVNAAQREEFLGRLVEAQKHYETAAFLVPENKDFVSLFRSAYILYELGFFDRSLAQARTIRSVSGDNKLIYDSILLSIWILYAQNELTEAKSMVFTLIEQLPAGSADADQLYSIHTLASRLGMEKEAETIAQKLAADYPDSIAFLMLTSPGQFPSITEYPNPASMLSYQAYEEKGNLSYTGVQTGSFVQKKHAEHMADELAAKGFNAIITEKKIDGKKFFTVIVPVNANTDPQHILIELKENGYEGFLLSEN